MKKKSMTNKELRTRRDLLQAASRLLKDGKGKPTMEDVAAEALVSRATVYRYFSNIDMLLEEAPLEGAVPSVDIFFEGIESDDPATRIEQVESLFHEITYQNEHVLRHMLANSISQGLSKDSPVRQNRRSEFIRKALVPVKKQLDKKSYDYLCISLAILIATESMIVCQDVLHLDESQAKKAKSWGVRMLVKAALQQSKGSE